MSMALSFWLILASRLSWAFQPASAEVKRTRQGENPCREQRDTSAEIYSQQILPTLKQWPESRIPLRQHARSASKKSGCRKPLKAIRKSYWLHVARQAY